MEALSTVAATRKTFPGTTANFGFTRVLLDSLYNSGVPSGMAVWYSKLANSSSYSNNRYYVLFGIPGLQVPRPDGLPLIQVERDTLFTGELNTVSGDAGLSSGLVLLEVQEAGLPRVYDMLGGGEIQYLQDGGTAWRGAATLSEGVFSAECRIPAQARTGTTARAEGNALALAAVRADAVGPGRHGDRRTTRGVTIRARPLRCGSRATGVLRTLSLRARRFSWPILRIQAASVSSEAREPG
ncbi:MAG: hypothetical protein MZU79_01740 [Anaerotruncus sp.]|nr:hypothetical protein [Anaerotruncus sp.]